MKLIKPEATLLQQSDTRSGMYKHIELCGRTCYKSENNITKDSANLFVDRLIANKHTAMLEHGTVYLNVLTIDDEATVKAINTLMHNPYTKCVRVMNKGIGYAITTNYRVIIEKGLSYMLSHMCSPTPYHERRFTFKLITDRGVSHELVRHRVFSFAQESQRYCAYDKDKFGNELTFITPIWLDRLCADGIEHNPNSGYSDMFTINDWKNLLQDIENHYKAARVAGLTPQEIRSILPNATKTELCMTGFASDWQHFFDLRLKGTTGAPHPDMKHLAELMQAECVKYNIWNTINNE